MKLIKQLKHSGVITGLLIAMCILSFSGCIAPNFSGVVDAIGRETTVFEPNDGHPRDLVVYRLGDAYYVEVQATWQHVPARCLYFSDPFQGETGGFRLWTEHDEQAPKHTYLVRLSACEVDNLLQKKVPYPPEDSARIIPKEQFDYKNARRCMTNPRRFPQYNSSKLSYGRADNYYRTYAWTQERRSWLNYAVQPLSWAMWAVDIPVGVAINGTLYLLMAPVMATQEVMIQQFGYEPWAEEPLPGPVINTAESPKTKP